jgi:hypothetical protein
MKKFIIPILLVTLVMVGITAQAQNKLDLKQIPTKIMDALKAKFPKAEIEKCTKEKEGEIFIYDFEFKQGEQKFETDIKEDGTIHNWEKAIKATDLPAAVIKAVDKMYPKARMQEIMQITAVKNGKDVPEGYEIVLKTRNKKEVEVMVAPDGKILEESTDKD